MNSMEMFLIASKECPMVVGGHSDGVLQLYSAIRNYNFSRSSVFRQLYLASRRVLSKVILFYSCQSVSQPFNHVLLSLYPIYNSCCLKLCIFSHKVEGPLPL